MKALTCHACQSKLVAYLHRQLPLAMLHRVGQHLDSCPVCYAAYIAQRDLSSELGASLLRFGQPENAQLGRMWAAIQADIQRPRTVARRPPLGRYGVALLMLALALLLPWSLGKSPVVNAVPHQPAAPVSTAEVTGAPTLVAMATPVMTADSTYARIPAAETPATPAGQTR